MPAVPRRDDIGLCAVGRAHRQAGADPIPARRRRGALRLPARGHGPDGSMRLEADPYRDTRSAARGEVDEPSGQVHAARRRLLPLLTGSEDRQPASAMPECRWMPAGFHLFTLDAEGLSLFEPAPAVWPSRYSHSILRFGGADEPPRLHVAPGWNVKDAAKVGQLSNPLTVRAPDGSTITALGLAPAPGSPLDRSLLLLTARPYPRLNDDVPFRLLFTGGFPATIGDARSPACWSCTTRPTSCSACRRSTTSRTPGPSR